MTDDASPENLRKFLESDDRAMVRMGISLAKGTGVEVTIKDLGRFLKSEDVETIKTGVMLADEADVGDEAMEMLCKPLGDEDYSVREAAARALGNIGDARAVDPLIEALADESEYVCSAAVEALGNIGDVRAVEPLTERSLTPFIDRVHVRENIAWALGQLGPYTDSNYHGRASDWLFEYFTYSSWNEDGVRVAAAWALGEIGAAEGLLEVVGETGTDEFGVAWSRGSAPEAVAAALEKSSGKPIVEYLIDALEVQPGAAAWMLGEIGDARAVEPLIATLGEEYLPYETYGTYEAIGEALVKIGDARAVEPLIEALGGGDEETNVREGAAKALGEFGDERAVEPLIEALGYDDEGVADAAKEALRKLGHEVE